MGKTKAAILALAMVAAIQQWPRVAAAESESGQDPQSPTPARFLALKISTSTVAASSKVPLAIPAPVEPETAELVEMPWLWRELRRTAHQYLPKKQVDRVHARLAPTVVSTGFDTVPGAGLEGQF